MKNVFSHKLLVLQQQKNYIVNLSAIIFHQRTVEQMTNLETSKKSRHNYFILVIVKILYGY